MTEILLLEIYKHCY